MVKSNPLHPEILAAALEGLELNVKRLDEQIAAIRTLMGRRGPGRPPSAEVTADQPERPKKRRKMSAEARKRIADAQKKRWAAVRKAQK